MSTVEIDHLVVYPDHPKSGEQAIRRLFAHTSCTLVDMDDEDLESFTTLEAALEFWDQVDVARLQVHLVHEGHETESAILLVKDPTSPEDELADHGVRLGPVFGDLPGGGS